MEWGALFAQSLRLCCELQNLGLQHGELLLGTAKHSGVYNTFWSMLGRDRPVASLLPYGRPSPWVRVVQTNRRDLDKGRQNRGLEQGQT